MRSRLSLALLAGAVVLGAVLPVWMALSTRTFDHDDSISYIAATANQGRYAASAPANRWVSVSEWQSFWRIDRFGAFRTISKDLADTDLHPPLYFWILHIWCHFVGITATTGPLLNLPFIWLTALVIALVCRSLRCSGFDSAFAGILWLVSGSALSIVIPTRQYGLLGLVSACLLFAAVRFLLRPGALPCFFLGVCAALGMLTHYHFVVPLFFVSLLAAVQLGRRRTWFPLAGMAATLCLAGAVFFVAHPDFVQSFARQQEWAPAFHWTDVPYRIARCAAALLAPFSVARIQPATMLDKGFFVVVAVLAGVVVVWLARGRTKNTTARLDRLLSVEWLPTLTMAATALVVCMLYVAHFSPRTAMGARYLALVAPCLFVAAGQSIGWLRQKGARFAAALPVTLLCWMMAVGTISATRHALWVDGHDTNPLRVEGASLILDSTARGVLPRFLWHADPASPVYAAMQTDLLGRFPDLPPEGTLIYVSEPNYGNTYGRRMAVLLAFADRGYRFVRYTPGVYGFGEVFEMRKPGR